MDYEKPMTLKNYVDAFDDGLEGVLHEKLLDLVWRYGKASCTLGIKLERASTWFNKIVVPNVLEEERPVYWEMGKFYYYKDMLKVDAILKELNNIYRAYRLCTKKEENNKELDLEELRNVPISRLYSGVLKKSGERLTGNCPKHKDENASFFIYPNNGFHCFGCGFHGHGAIDYLIELEDIDFLQAVERLSHE